MKKESIGNISHEAIYQFIYAQVHRKGWGEIRRHYQDLRVYLRYGRKRRLKKGVRKCQRIFKPLIDYSGNIFRRKQTLPKSRMKKY